MFTNFWGSKATSLGVLVIKPLKFVKQNFTPRLGGEHGSETLFLIFPFLAFRTHVRVQTTILEMIAYLPTFGLNLRKSVGKYSIHEAFEFFLQCVVKLMIDHCTTLFGSKQSKYLPKLLELIPKPELRVILEGFPHFSE